MTCDWDGHTLRLNGMEVLGVTDFRRFFSNADPEQTITFVAPVSPALHQRFQEVEVLEWGLNFHRYTARVTH